MLKRKLQFFGHLMRRVDSLEKTLWYKYTYICIYTIHVSHFGHIRLFAILWTTAYEAPLSMGFSRQEYWSGLPCPPPGDLSDPGTELASLTSPTLAGGFFTYEPPGKDIYIYIHIHTYTYIK